MTIELPASEMPKPKIDTSKTEFSDSEIIDRLSGTSAVARMFGIKPPSVSAWRETGIPRSAMMFLWEKHPKVLTGEIRYGKVRKSDKEKKE